MGSRAPSPGAVSHWAEDPWWRVVVGTAHGRAAGLRSTSREVVETARESLVIERSDP